MPLAFAESRLPMKRLQDALGLALGLVILLAFLAGLILLLYVPFEMHRLNQARTWPARRGVITQASASKVYHRGGGFRWTFVLRGAFQDRAETFTLTRVRYGEFGLGRREAYCRSVVARYPVGRVVDVYSSPANPRDRILEPFAPWNQVWIALGTGLGLVLLPGILFLFRKRY